MYFIQSEYIFMKIRIALDKIKINLKTCIGIMYSFAKHIN